MLRRKLGWIVKVCLDHQPENDRHETAKLAGKNQKKHLKNFLCFFYSTGGKFCAAPHTNATHATLKNAYTKTSALALFIGSLTHKQIEC
jgi:hypothetical protein